MIKRNMNISAIILVLILVIGMHFVLTSLTPYYGDDYAYMMVFSKDAATETEPVRVTDISSLIRSQMAHYYVMNGRTVAHTLAQLFLMLPKVVFNIINALAFALLGLLICFHAAGNCRSIKVFDLLLTYASLLLLAPKFAQSYLWVVGSCNYLFTFVIVLLFLIPYRISWDKTSKSNVFLSVISTLAMLAFGVIAGNTNENVGVSLVVVLLLYAVAYIVYNRKIKVWMIAGWLGTLAGSIVCIMAPGNVVRSGGSLVEQSVASVARNAIGFSNRAVENFAPLFVGLLVMSCGILLVKSRKNQLSKAAFIASFRKYFLLYFYGIFFLGTVYAMSVPGQFPDRAWSHPLALLIVVCLMVYRKFMIEMDLKAKERRFITMVNCLVVALVLGLGYSSALPTVRAVHVTHQYRVSLIQEAKANNEDEVAIPSMYANSRFTCQEHVGDVSEDPTFWTNKAMARYFGIGDIYKSEDIEI